MKTVYSKLLVFILTVSICIAAVGCASKQTLPEPSENTTQTPALKYSLEYYFNISFSLTNGDYVSQDILQLLKGFAKAEYITPATPAVEVYTEIPEIENNAKGTDPVSYLLPDLDLSKYRTCAWRDAETGVETSGWYRMIGGQTYGMMTDELVAYDVDASQNITQYKTVNLGKYDALGLDESRLESLRIEFSQTISEEIGAKMFYQYYYTTTSQTPFRIYTDANERIIIATTITLEQNAKPLQVDLFAVVS